MRVALVCPYDLDRPGGVQAQVVGLQGELAQRGHEAFVVGPGTPRPGESFRSVGGSTVITANRSAAPIALNPRSARAVRRLTADADVLHVHEPLMPLIAWAGLGSDLPTVATFHADPPGWVKRLYRAGRVVVRRLTGDATVTAVSEVAAVAVRRLGLAPIIIPNGVTVPPSVIPPDGRAHEIVFLGRDDARKGLDVLLEAFEGIRRRFPEWTLRVLGASRPRRPGVTFEGRVSDARRDEVLGRASIYCAPNLGGESFGIVLVEAMAAGAAVLASDLMAFRAVAAGAAAFAPVGSASRLGDELAALMADRARRASLSTAGRTRAEAFAWHTVTDQYLDVYARAAAGHLRR